MLTVYSPEQAEALDGMTVPILVLQPVRRVDPGSVLHSMLVAGRVQLVLQDLHHLAGLILLAREMGVRIPLHIQLHTGLHCGGGRADESSAAVVGVGFTETF